MCPTTSVLTLWIVSSKTVIHSQQEAVEIPVHLPVKPLGHWFQFLPRQEISGEQAVEQYSENRAG